MARLGLRGVLLRRTASFSWFTGGRHNHVSVASETGVASILVTAERTFLLASRIEAPRMADEEELKSAGFEFVVGNWYEPPPSPTDLAGGPVGADGFYPDTRNIAADLARLRYSLTGDEIARYRWLGQAVGSTLQQVTASLTTGLTEDDIAGRLGGALLAQGIFPCVLLVATDERIFRYRHPIPTGKRLERYAMLVIGGRRWGLNVSCTRLVHFGPLPEDLRRKAEATARIDATLIAATRPGARIADIFHRAQEAYAASGHPDEWQLHHQGGACGYEGRDYRATPTSEEIVQNNQAFAWNPSITGSKSEDTIIVSNTGFEIISAAAGWPMLTVAVDGHMVERPAILER